MSRLGTGILAIVALVLLALNARLLGRLTSVEEKLDQLSKSGPPAPRTVSAPPSEDEPRRMSTNPPREEARPSRSDPQRQEPNVESSGHASGTFTLPGWSGWKTVSGASRPVPETPLELPDLTEVQKRAIAELEEARRKEQLQIDGELAARRRELNRRYDALVRACLSPEQQQRYDEHQRASAPRRDGPLTANVKSYLDQDPAPYDLEVEWHGSWWPARTVSVQGDLTLIHYVGHGNEWHEWVPPERVRPHQP
jgi:hypothetical protein